MGSHRCARPAGPDERWLATAVFRAATAAAVPRARTPVARGRGRSARASSPGRLGPVAPPAVPPADEGEPASTTPADAVAKKDSDEFRLRHDWRVSYIQCGAMYTNLPGVIKHPGPTAALFWAL